MDNWDEYSQFRDTIHGYIKIHKPLVKKIINTSQFQRLKYIEQTGMGVLYPSATHNRFGHSLGVYHLGTLAFAGFKNKVLSGYKEECYYINDSLAGNKKSAEILWSLWEILFKIACLLHDIGHTPFSHSLEVLYDHDYNLAVPGTTPEPENSKMNKGLVRKLKENKEIRLDDFMTVINSKKHQHERMSAYLVLCDFSEIINELIISYIEFFLEKNYPLDKDRNIREVASIKKCGFDSLEFIVRMITGVRYDWENSLDKYFQCWIRKVSRRRDAWNRELQLRNCIIKLLNSSIDVDNLDYATRDTHYSGYANSLVDHERILNSFTVIEGQEYDNADLDGQIHNPVACKKFEGFGFDVLLQGKCKLFLSEHNDKSKSICAEGELIMEDGSTPGRMVKNDKMHTGEYFSAMVKNESARNKLELSSSGEDGSDAFLYLTGKIKGKFTGKIYGKTSGLNKGTLFFELAMDKTSQSVVDGAVAARNYEYLWIYTHHTITYQTNFLIMHMLAQYCEILYERDQYRILNEILEILSNPFMIYPLGNGNSIGKDINVHVIFYNLFTAVLASKIFMDIIGASEQNPERVQLTVIIGELMAINIDNKKTMPKKNNLITVLEKLKKFLKKIAPMGKVAFFLVDLTNIYIEFLNGTGISQKKLKMRMIYLQEYFRWIILFFNWAYYIKAIDKNVYTIYINIFRNFVDLTKKLMQNVEADDAEKVGKYLTSHEIRRQKEIFNRIVTNYMSDVIAMPGKRRIGSFMAYRSCDDDLNTYYRLLERDLLTTKNEKNRTLNEREFIHVSNEYFSRQFSTAMWKSFAEFKHLFKKWTPEEKERMYKTIGERNSKNMPHLDPLEYTYMVLSENTKKLIKLTPIQGTIYELMVPRNIIRLVVVKQEVRAKSLDDNTFFAFKERVMRAKDIGLLNKININEIYFYFYYKRKDGYENLKIQEITSFIDDLQMVIKEDINS